MTVLRYTIAGPPVSTNQGYSGRIIGRRAGLILTADGRGYKFRLQVAARKAWMRAGRPPALTQAQVAARLFFPTLGSDIDGPVKFLLDSLQAGGLVVNDTRIRRLVLEKPDPDGDPRIEVAVGPLGHCCPTCGCACGGLQG